MQFRWEYKSSWACPKERQRTRGEKRSSLVRDSFVSRPWFARPSSVIRSSLVRGSPTDIGDGLANCFIIGSIINLKMYCYSIKGKPYSLYGVEQSGMKARRVLLQNRSIGIYSWLWIICFGSEAYSFPIKRNRPWFWAVLARNHGRICLGIVWAFLLKSALLLIIFRF